jgi:nucleoside-diphosphate-sugar epimerase
MADSADPTILITGATGFIGGAVTAQLLSITVLGRVLLLIRAANQESARNRALNSITRFEDRAVLEPGWHRCEIIVGDLTDPQFLEDRRLDTVTHVLHLAANTSFRSVRSVRQTNIQGTFGLAQRMRRSSRLMRFLYVGTAYICGANPLKVVRENDYPCSGVRHLAEYTNSKAECETLLESIASELHLVIARPSVVVGHTRLGCEPSASIFWYYRTVDLLRRVPVPLQTRKDIIPVNYAADALLLLLFKRELKHRRYHISAGEAGAVSWGEMAAEFAQCYGDRPENPYRVVDFQTLLEERSGMREFLGDGDEERLLRALEMYFRFSASGVEVFDNERLLEEGMAPPPRFTSYLQTCAALPSNRSVYEQMLDDS